jgi:predicted nucleic-acid-binding Zn-ribbon protein
MTRMATTNKRCPKCGSRSFSVEETVQTTSYFESDNGKVTFGGQDGREIVHIRAKCRNCGHAWFMRKSKWFKEEKTILDGDEILNSLI